MTIIVFVIRMIYMRYNTSITKTMSISIKLLCPHRNSCKRVNLNKSGSCDKLRYSISMCVVASGRDCMYSLELFELFELFELYEIYSLVNSNDVMPKLIFLYKLMPKFQFYFGWGIA